jgi:sec-independent protein translocase protein TatA
VIGDILQPTHLLLILAVALLVLGPKRLPGAGRALGRGLREFRAAITAVDPRDDLVNKPGLERGTAADPPDQSRRTP